MDKVKKPKLSQYPAIQGLLIVCFPSDPSVYLPLLLFSKESLIIEHKKKIIGVIHTLSPFSKDMAFLHHICVDKQYRKRGIGKKLMKAMLTLLNEKGYKKTRLRVNKKEDWLISFYKKFKFKKIKSVFMDTKYLMERK